MNVRTRIIKLFVLMIVVVSCILVIFMLFSISEMGKRGDLIHIELDANSQRNVGQELQDLADNISNYILVVEAEIDRSMLNAARVLYEFDRLTGGMTTQEDLERIRLDTGMSDLYLGDMDGVFTLSTEPESIGISLFDIWEGYRMLVTGESVYLPSDLKVKAETGEIFKFTAIPRADGRGILESALDASVIEVYLQRFIDNNESIRSMNLFDFELMTLTSNQGEGAQTVYTKGVNVPRGTSDIDDFFGGHREIKLEMDRQNARIYYPVIEGDRVRYVLFIDLDTTGYFATQDLIDESIRGLVRESAFLSDVSLGSVFVTLLIFTIFISFIVNKLIKKLEEATRSAEIASKAKSVFLSNMSHEIRTPMNAIIGMTSIGRTAGGLDRKNDCFEKIDGASKHLLGVINDILDMSKIEAGKFALSESDFEFGKIIERIVSVNKFRMEEMSQKFTVHMDENIPQFLYGDDQRMSQVITNLISNATKFTPVGGSVKLGAECVGEENGVYTIQVTVADTGIGISPEQQANIFSSFQQAENSTSRKYGGTGLGLAISKSIVEMMGGKIWIESELGKGAVFSFTVQARRGEGKPDAETEEYELEGQFEGHCILLAEDVEINREIVLALLEPTLLTIDCAVNGREAVEMFAAAPNKYELIFMDMQMPEMDGLDATRQIRALDNPRAKTVPIVAMTANAFKEDIFECLDAGMNSHLSKPLDFDAVFNKLRIYLLSGSPDALVWDTRFELGDATVDRQHKGLCEITNRLLMQYDLGKDAATLRETMTFFVDYAEHHFENEEALQVRVGYPEYEAHKLLHDDFKNTIEKLTQEYLENGSTDFLIKEIRETCMTWLTDHIQNDDMKIGKYLRARELQQ